MRDVSILSTPRAPNKDAHPTLNNEYAPSPNVPAITSQLSAPSPPMLEIFNISQPGVAYVGG